jgi:hypothetical protein
MTNVVDLFDAFKVKIEGKEVNWVKDEIEALREFLLGYAYLRHHEPKLYYKFIDDDIFLVKLHDLEDYTKSFPTVAAIAKHADLFKDSILYDIGDVPYDTEEGLKQSIRIKETVRGR